MKLLLAITLFVVLVLPPGSSAQNCSPGIPCEFGALCIPVSGLSTCVCPSQCGTEPVSPVCGDDGITYPNTCALNRRQCTSQTNIAIASNGSCDPCSSVTCPFGATCFLNINSGNATCGCAEQCSNVSNPVCGSNNVTYANPCMLKNTACIEQIPITIKNNGSCDPCAAVKCLFGASCVVEMNGNQTGQSIARCVCNESCPTTVSKVCGTDDVTYENVCLLRNASCTQQMNISVAHNGSCDPCFNVKCLFGAQCVVENGKGQCVCNHVCPTNYQPVCGSNGKTLGNICLLHVTSCVKQTNITLVHDGPCNLCGSVNCSYGAKCVAQNGKGLCTCNQYCPSVYQPVCGSHGKTYGNPCLLGVASCLKQMNITIVYPGKCISCQQVKCAVDEKCIIQNSRAKCTCNLECPKMYRPVCGTDGHSYRNACLLKVARCVLKKRIEISYQGRCNPCALVRCRFYAKCLVVNNAAKCVCDSVCPKVHLPICASNRRTYENLCFLKYDSCVRQKYIGTRYHRRCY